MATVTRAQVALSTGSLYNLGLDRVFELASRAGYDGVELLVDARRDTYDVPYLERLRERWGMPILSVHSPFARRVDGWPDASEGRAEQALRLAEAVAAEAVVVHTPLCWHLVHGQSTLRRRPFGFIVPWPNRAEARYARWLCKELPLLQAGSRVRIALENMPARRFLGFIGSLYRFVSVEELCRWPHLVLDTTHWGTWGVDPLAVYQALRGRVVHVHLSDYDGREHRVPFEGRLGLERLVRRLGEDGFRGVVVVELDPWAVARGDWTEGNLMGRLAGVVGEVRVALGATSSHSQPTRAATASRSGL